MTGPLLDVNVLLALAFNAHQHHRAAMAWFGRLAEWGTCPLTEAAFLRLVMNPRVTGRHIPGAHAVAALQSVRGIAGHRFLADDTTLAEPLIDTGHLVGRQQATDFHLVNLAARHGVRLATFDGSIQRALAPADRGHVVVVPS